MGMDRWAVLKGDGTKEGKFVLAFQDSSLPHGKPFMETGVPTSEVKVREELEKLGISKAEIDAAIAKVR